MANKKVLLEEENGDKLYLHTLTDIVFDAEGNNLDQKFSAINQTLEALEGTDANAEIVSARTSGLTDKAFNNLGDRIDYAEIAVGTTIAPDKKSKINFYITDEETTETWSDSVKLGDLNAHNTHTASHSDIRESVQALVQDKADKNNAAFTGTMTLNDNGVATTDKTGEYTYVKEFVVSAPASMTNKTIKLSFSGFYVGKINVMAFSRWAYENSFGYIEKEFNSSFEGTSIRSYSSRYLNNESLAYNEFSIGEFYIEGEERNLLIKSLRDTSVNNLHIRVEFTTSGMHTSFASVKTLTCSEFYSDATPNNDNSIALATTEKTEILQEQIDVLEEGYCTVLDIIPNFSKAVIGILTVTDNITDAHVSSGKIMLDRNNGLTNPIEINYIIRRNHVHSTPMVSFTTNSNKVRACSFSYNGKTHIGFDIDLSSFYSYNQNFAQGIKIQDIFLVTYFSDASVVNSEISESLSYSVVYGLNKLFFNDKELATTSKTEILLTERTGVTIISQDCFQINNCVYIDAKIKLTSGASFANRIHVLDLPSGKGKDHLPINAIGSNGSSIYDKSCDAIIANQFITVIPKESQLEIAISGVYAL